MARVVGAGSPSAVGDAHEFDTALPELDPVIRRAFRVESVVDQFLDDRGGPIDDLARRDLVDDQRRELPDARWGCQSQWT